MRQRLHDPIRHTLHMQFYLVFAAITADTVAAALLRTAALYLAGGEVEKLRKPSKKLVTTFPVELLKLVGRKRKTENRKDSKER